MEEARGLLRCVLFSKLVYITEEVSRVVNMRASNTTSVEIEIIISTQTCLTVITEIESLEFLFLCTNTAYNSSLHF